MNRFAVETHPESRQIAKDIAEGKKTRDIAAKYDISRECIINYRKKALPKRLTKVVERKELTDAKQLFDIIRTTVGRMEKLSNSCDDYLTDPNKPDQYFVGPQGKEIDIVYYTVNKKGEQIKKKGSLQELLEKIEKSPEVDSIVEVKHKSTDPRILLVKSAETLTKQMDTLVGAWKAVDQGKTNLFNTKAWDEVIQAILRATEKYPEVREDIISELKRIENGDY